jgi:hypothetical protein
MDHTYVEENQVADRYVMGTLPAEEAERFEDHYLSCPDCLDRLELTESVERGFKRMAGQEAAKLATAHQLAVVAWLARLGRMRQLGVLLAALLVVAVLPMGVEIHKATQLAQARSTLEQERKRPAATRALQDELGREREARTRAEGKLAQALLPRAAVVAFLGVERGEPGGSWQALRPPAGVWIVLEAPVDPPFHSPYRAVVRNGQGKEVSRVEGLQPNERSSLSLSLPPMPPGAYSLTIEPGGQRFNFRILSPDKL